MRKTVMAAVAVSSLALAGCTTTEGAVSGGVIGAAVGGFGTNSVGGAIVGAGVGALAGAVLVEHLQQRLVHLPLQGQLYRDTAAARPNVI